MTALTIDERNECSVAVLSLDGYVDADTAPQLYRRLSDLRESGQRKFVVDCRGVTYLSSHGIWTLVKHIILVREEGGDIRLAAISPEIEMILRDLNMETFFKYYSDLDEAIRSFCKAS